MSSVRQVPRSRPRAIIALDPLSPRLSDTYYNDRCIGFVNVNDNSVSHIGSKSSQKKVLTAKQVSHVWLKAHSFGPIPGNRNSWNYQNNSSFPGLVWLQTCQNQLSVTMKVLQPLWNQSSPKTNNCLAYSNYSYYGIGPKERTLKENCIKFFWK